MKFTATIFIEDCYCQHIYVDADSPEAAEEAILNGSYEVASEKELRTPTITEIEDLAEYHPELDDGGE